VHEHAITPLLDLPGDRWSQHRGGIAEEHFFIFFDFLSNKPCARCPCLTLATRAVPG
jgi:hypothetical protein